MPDRMNGRELAEDLWAEWPKLKVIFTSVYSAGASGSYPRRKQGIPSPHDKGGGRG